MNEFYTIHVMNNTHAELNFFIFQSPAIYYPDRPVYSTSIFTGSAPPYASTGEGLTLRINKQILASAQTLTTQPVIGQPSGYVTATRAMELTRADGSGEANTTDVMINPFGLGHPRAEVGVQKGAFRINTPFFDPRTDGYVNVGSAVLISTGEIIASSFIVADPIQCVDCRPLPIFHVQTGRYNAGTVMNFTQVSHGSAVCNSLYGDSSFYVSYNADETWSIRSCT